MKRFSLLALLALAGCYATAEPLYLPDGTSGYRITCGNYIGAPADCIEKAGDICGPNGYQMFDEAGRPKTPEAQNQAIIAALNNGSSKHGSSDSSQSAMFIKCKTMDMPLHMTPAPMLPSVETNPVPPAPVPLSPPLVAPSIAPLSVAPPSTPAANTGPIPLH